MPLFTFKPVYFSEEILSMVDFDKELVVCDRMDIGYILPGSIPPSQLTQKYIETLKRLL